MRTCLFILILLFAIPLNSFAEVGEAPPANKAVKVFIDPGHGGEDKGAVGVRGVLEKTVTLNIAKLLEAMLKDRLGLTVMMSRTEDKGVSLTDRGRLANYAEADLFVSIHANASRPKTYHGIETYYLNNNADQASQKLAERENASLGEGNSDIGFMFSDIIQSAKLEDSISLAHYINSGMVDQLKKKYSKIRDLGVKQGPFYVLVGAHMPCVLTEVSFIDHPVEGKNLITEKYQRDIAEGIFNGIKHYLLEKKKIETGDSTATKS